MTTNITLFGEADQRTQGQIRRCLDAEEGALGVLCADNHLGYSMPIGGVIAYRNHTSPSGVGYDIGCGNKAVLTDINYDEIRDSVPRLMDEIFGQVSFGVGRNDGTSADHPVIDQIADSPFEPQRSLKDLAAKQLGTVGAGNHYVDLFRDEQDRIWVGVHFGSRGFGHKTATGFLSLAAGGEFDGRASDGEMDAPPTLLSLDTDLGQSYMAAMQTAGAYAYAGRDVVCDKVLGILGARAVDEVHNHHNFAWMETHNGETYCVVRKGATPAFPGQRGFVGATMRGTSVILEGVDSSRSQGALYSTVHGAGRVMSRTEAAGKKRKRWSCNNRDCAWVQPPKTHKPNDGRCPACGNDKLTKRWIQERAGRIDWPAVEADLALAGIELRGANAEEAPGAYKDLEAVLAAHDGTVRVVHRLTPLGVAMAPGETVDPYKD